MVVLVPILVWVNGPAVSTDQYVVRVAVFVLALAGGIGIQVVSDRSSNVPFAVVNRWR